MADGVDEVFGCGLRVGRSVGRTLYRMLPDGSEELIGVVDTRELAGAIVAAVNARAVPVSDTPPAAIAAHVALPEDTRRQLDAICEARRLNLPMLARLRRCAADASPNYDDAFTIYPPEAVGLVALIDAVDALGVGPWVSPPCGHDGLIRSLEAAHDRPEVGQ